MADAPHEVKAGATCYRLGLHCPECGQVSLASDGKAAWCMTVSCRYNTGDIYRRAKRAVDTYRRTKSILNRC